MGGIDCPDRRVYGDQLRLDAPQPLPVSRRGTWLADGRRALERQGDLVDTCCRAVGHGCRACRSLAVRGRFARPAPPARRRGAATNRRKRPPRNKAPRHLARPRKAVHPGRRRDLSRPDRQVSSWPGWLNDPCGRNQYATDGPPVGPRQHQARRGWAWPSAAPAVSQHRRKARPGQSLR